jgi:hypothetical protein
MNAGAHCAVEGEKYRQAAVPEKSVANIAISEGDSMATKKVSNCARMVECQPREMSAPVSFMQCQRT